MERARGIYSPVPLSLDHTRGPHPALRQGKLESPHPAKAGLSCPKPVAVRKRERYTKEAFPLSERPCHRGMPRAQVCIRRKAIATYTTCLPTDSSPRARHSKRSAQQSTQTVSEKSTPEPTRISISKSLNVSIWPWDSIPIRSCFARKSYTKEALTLRRRPCHKNGMPRAQAYTCLSPN